MTQHNLQKIVDAFLQAHCKSARPLFLGFSGGADSTALFYLLLDYRARRLLALHAVHVDHGWHPESGKQAAFLQTLCKEHGVPFHLKELHMDCRAGNLEDAARKERLRFFRELSLEFNAQAVVLAHHQDDQAETVLKRFFEGASVVRAYGMQPVSTVEGVLLWRPLLQTPRSQLIEWLKKIGPSYHLDPANQNEHFLRPRMRSRLFPHLDALFGKKVAKPLTEAAKEAFALESYLNRQVAPFLAASYQSPLGVCLDLSRRFPTHKVELVHLLRIFCRNLGFVLSKENLRIAQELLQKKAAGAKVCQAGFSLLIDRRRIFYCKHPLPSLPKTPFALLPGVSRYGPWEVVVEPVYSFCQHRVGWKALWQGHLEMIAAAGRLHFCLASKKSRLPFRSGKSLDALWTETKVPRFLCTLTPLLQLGDQVIGEPLSASVQPQCTRAQQMWRIKLSL